MTTKEREAIIEYIKANDSTYNYNAVNFKYYSHEDLLILKRRLDRDKMVSKMYPKSSNDKAEN